MLVNCKECKKEISSESRFCFNCGRPIYQEDIEKDIDWSKWLSYFFVFVFLLICIYEGLNWVTPDEY